MIKSMEGEKMDLGEFAFIVGTAMASMGGAGAIILITAKWIGGVWADRLSQNLQHQYDIQLAQHQNQLDVFRASLLRYTGEQFSLYNKLWHSLYDLKNSGDELWEKADDPNLRIFSKQFKITSDEIEKNYLLLEKNHYEQLIELLKPLKEYQVRKGELILKRARTKAGVTQDDINQLIDDNRQTKQNYEKLLDTIREDFRKQIRGEEQSSKDK